jgi:hypothetical protein
MRIQLRRHTFPKALCDQCREPAAEIVVWNTRDSAEQLCRDCVTKIALDILEQLDKL